LPTVSYSKSSSHKHEEGQKPKGVSCLRMGHTGLNATMYTIGKHPTGLCTYCDVQETVKHC